MLKVEGQIRTSLFGKKAAFDYAENNLLRQNLAVVDMICGETSGTGRDQVGLHLGAFKRQKKRPAFRQFGVKPISHTHARQHFSHVKF